MNWLESLMSQTGDLESPRRYFYFAGLATLSAAAGRKMWLDRGGAYKLYPNLFVMLVGPSGIKKGLPIRVAEKLVTEMKYTKVIAGRSSIQAIIEHLGHQTMDSKGDVSKDASAFIVSGEFSQSILDDSQAFTILTDLYDSQWKDEHTNLLKSGKSILRNVYLTMLSASNQVHLHSVIGQRDIQGGFVARTLIVNEDKRNKKNALVRKQVNTIDYEGLVKRLKEITNLKGEFDYESDAADFYENWYNEYEPDVEDNTGTNNRLPDTILKVAMLLSLARGDSMTIAIPDLQESIAVCLGCTVSTQQITHNAPSSTTTPAAKQTAVVLETLLRAPSYRLTRRELVRKLWRNLDAFELTRVADTLKEAKVIREEVLGVETHYIIQDHVIAEYVSHQERA